MGTHDLLVIHLLLLIAVGSSHRKCDNHYFRGSTRIIDGLPVRIQDVPFMASLAIKSGDHLEFVCGASIIGDHWVLTAYHCVLAFEDEFLTPENAAILSNSVKWKSGIVREVEDWHYPEYGDVGKDIALIRVRRAFRGRHERPIALAEDGYILRERTAVKVVGWGTVSRDLIVPNQLLEGVTLQLYSDETCRQIYGNLSKMYNDEEVFLVTDEMMCAGPRRDRPGSDSCHFDSGGPLIDDNLLIGVVSWGPKAEATETLPRITCGMGYPGVYTRVWKFELWIRKVEVELNETIARFGSDPDWLHPECVELSLLTRRTLLTG